MYDAPTIVDENVSAATRPVVRLRRGPPYIVRRRQVNGDEVQAICGQLLLHEEREKLAELCAAPRENHHLGSRSELATVNSNTAGSSKYDGVGTSVKHDRICGNG